LRAVISIRCNARWKKSERARPLFADDPDMTYARIEAALRDGDVELPAEGRLLVLRADPEMARVLPVERCDVVHGFSTDHAAWASAGAAMMDTPGEGYGAALVACPRGRDHARRLVAEALNALVPGGLLLVDGQKTDGIEPLLKALKASLTGIEVMSKAHGKLIWLTRPDPLPVEIAAWAMLAPTAPDGWVTAPGVFSSEAIDAGSALLAQNLPKLKGRVCDLGAGWGYLSRAMLEVPKLASLALVEAERAALEAARTNITDPRATFHWADARTFGAPQSYDFVVTNPPFHTGRAAEPSLGQAFLARGGALLKRSGTLALVANRHLPYVRVLSEQFADVQTVALSAGYKVIHATRPRQSR
jgi:16S rRNA (guanine1207-N2)-methyltransferase